MVYYFKLLLVMLFVSNFSCNNKSTVVPELTLTNDQIVQVLVDIYCAKAAVELNDLNVRDSVHRLYFKQVSESIGQPMEVIETDFEKLRLMPDTLILLQNRALDTLRTMLDKANQQPSASIGVN